MLLRGVLRVLLEEARFDLTVLEARFDLTVLETDGFGGIFVYTFVFFQGLPISNPTLQACSFSWVSQVKDPHKE